MLESLVLAGLELEVAFEVFLDSLDLDVEGLLDLGSLLEKDIFQCGFDLDLVGDLLVTVLHLLRELRREVLELVQFSLEGGTTGAVAAGELIGSSLR